MKQSDIYSFAAERKYELRQLLQKNRLAAFRKIAINMNITFTDKEKKLINLLMNVMHDKSPDTVLRIAGGYVRDKLLGKESHDIDIAINNMSGEAFARLVIDWMKEHNMNPSGMSVVKSNPGQSKHLETAMVTILGQDIDFVNLRKETYADTRIPTIEPGTPEEDASRRDLTINSLFYNINTGEIEDFIGTGIEDLKKGIIRTPIDPVQTFLDDPLRILRAIRFATRYNFELAPELIEAAKNPQVQDALREKVSPERVWKELAGAEEPEGWKQGFLSGPNPAKAARMLGILGLRDLLFRPTEEEAKALGVEWSDWDASQNNPHHDLSIWEHTMAAFDVLINDLTTDEQKKQSEDYLVRNLAMLLHDIGKCNTCSRQTHEEGHYTYRGHDESSANLAAWALKKLKAPSHIIDRVKRLISEHMRLHTIGNSPSNKTLRKFIKDLAEDWNHSVDLAVADTKGKAKPEPNAHEHYEAIRSRLQELAKELKEGGGTTAPKRPITGNDLINELGFKPGPLMGQALKSLDDALLENPAMTREEAIDFIKAMKLV